MTDSKDAPKSKATSSKKAKNMTASTKRVFAHFLPVNRP